jgi:penicillin-binding protein 1A
MRSLIRLVATVLIAAIGVTATIVAITPQVAKMVTDNTLDGAELPPFDPISQRSVMYDAVGNVIGTFQAENQIPVAYAAIPQGVIDSVLAVEDESFFLHKGVNAKSLLRAVLANVSAGGIQQGGSTITQQLVKLSFLSSRQDADRKLLEASYAVELEKKFTKQQILERYLNIVYFGNGAYGIQAAAEMYFNKNVGQLTLADGAFLAGLIRNPTGYDPFRYPDRSKARRAQALDRLVATGHMTEAQAAAVNATPIPAAPQRAQSSGKATSYFADQVKDLLLNKTTILGTDQQQRYNAFFRGGLKIYTTLNPALQVAAEQARATQMPSTNGRFDAAIVSLDTKTGAVRAMTGGPGFDQLQLNLTLQPRQTGSAVKFMILSGAIEAGVQANDLIDGTAPCTLPNPGDPKHPFVITDAVSGGVGPIDSMTWRSINCAFGKLALGLGLDRVVGVMKRMGITSKLLAVPALATGGNEISPLDMASAFTSITNLGIHHDPYYIERIDGPDGKPLYEHKDPGTQVLDPNVAAQAVDILKTPILRGTGRRAQLAGGRPAAGKTGTQDSNTNAWFVGGTPQYTTAVWMGDWRNNTDDMTNIKEFKAFPKVQGGTYPALIWKAYMDAASAGLPMLDWPKPAPFPRPAARLYLPGTECTAAAGPNGNPVTKNGAIGLPPPTPTLPGGAINYAAPFPSVPAGAIVYDCRTGPPKPTTTTTATSVDPNSTSSSAVSTPPSSAPDTTPPKKRGPPTTPKSPPTSKKK